MEEKREQTERTSLCAAVLETAAPAEAGAKKLRVLVAMDVYLPNVDGVVNVMRNHLLHFPDWVEATAVGPKAKYYTDTDPYPIIRYKGFHVPFLKTVDFGFPSRDKAFLQRVREMDLDIIHVHTPFGVCKALTKLAREKGIPIVATFHTNYRMVFKHIFWLPFIYEPYIRTLGRRYGRMDEMFAATGATEAQLRSFGYKGSCSIVPFGTSLKEPEDRMQYVRRANELYGLREDETVFCFVGRLVKSKRVQFTLKALRIVRDRGYSFKFLVGGIGNYERALRRKIKKLGLSDCVVMTGFLESEGLKTVYSRADLQLFPSILDNFALVKVEAATFCTPGLYLRGSNTAYGTTDMRNAILAENRVEDFADKIEWALTHPRELAEIGQHAHDELYFSWEDAAAMQAKEYLRVIREYRQKHGAEGAEKG